MKRLLTISAFAVMAVLLVAASFALAHRDAEARFEISESYAPDHVQSPTRPEPASSS